MGHQELNDLETIAVGEKHNNHEVKKILCGVAESLEMVCGMVPSGNIKNMLCGMVGLLKMICNLLPA